MLSKVNTRAGRPGNLTTTVTAPDVEGIASGAALEGFTDTGLQASQTYDINWTTLQLKGCAEMKMPDMSQVYAASRHVASFAAGTVFYASMTGIINAGDAGHANDAFMQIGAGIKEIVAGVTVLIPIGMGAIAAIKASPIVQMLMGAAALLHNKTDVSKVSVEDQKTIMEATGKLPKVNAVVTNDPVIAAQTSPNIISSANVQVKA